LVIRTVNGELRGLLASTSKAAASIGQQQAVSCEGKNGALKKSAPKGACFWPRGVAYRR
jgi:hypothetical protein